MQIATKEDVNALFAELRAMRQRLDELAPPPEWLSVDAYAAKRGVSVATVYRWIRSGQVQARGAGKLREVKCDTYSREGEE